jgi:hypothetical protein
MWALKKAGLISRFPNGERKHNLPKLSKNKTIRKAQRLLEEAMARTTVIVSGDQTKGEKLGEAVNVGLDLVLSFLHREINAEKNPKLFLAQINTALSAISSQARLDSAALQAITSGLPVLPDEEVDDRLERVIRKLTVLQAEEQAAMEEQGEGEILNGEGEEVIEEQAAE